MTMDILLLRLEGPLISFGAPIVDQIGAIQEFPGLSMVAGLLANALGYDHRDFAKTQALQDRLEFACRRDRDGMKLTDYHTVDLGQEHLVDTGWTTWGRCEERGKGAATSGTHIRLRDYWADSAFTLALALADGVAPPGLDGISAALERPARPLFLGRKCCLPSVPLLLGRIQCPSLLLALRSAPDLSPGRRQPGRTRHACWPFAEGAHGTACREVRVTDARD